MIRQKPFSSSCHVVCLLTAALLITQQANGAPDIPIPPVTNTDPSSVPATSNPALPVHEGLNRILDDGTIIEWSPSPNYDARNADLVILHHTATATTDKALHLLKQQNPAVSAHYLITKEGKILQLVREQDRAWHAGESQWHGRQNLNASTIGIELVNTGQEPFPDAQIQALLVLLQEIRLRNTTLHRTSFIGHADIAPTRKNDPSEYFPWATLAEYGFGLWYDRNALPAPPPDFNPVTALRELGYDTRNLPKAIEAFKRHYIQTSVDAVMTTYDKSVLYSLVLQLRELHSQGLE